MNKELEDAAGMELPEGEEEDFWVKNNSTNKLKTLKFKMSNVHCLPNFTVDN